MKKLLALVLALIMVLGLLAGCNEQTGGSETTDPGKQPTNPGGGSTGSNDDVYQMKGSVTIAYPEAEIAEIQPVLEAFRKQYPNIKVVEEPFPGSYGGAFNEYLSQKAAANDITGFKISEEESRIAAFCSASGGVGSSTMAAACALHFAKQGKKVLYLNLEKFGSADMFFSGQGQFDMSDIIFALKSKKTNFPIKLESCVKQDSHGVYFYSQTKNALDMQELNADDAVRLISELNLMGGYNYIILDMDFGVDENILKIYRQAQAIILVGDGTMESNAKTERAYSAIAIKEANADVPLTNRMAFVYNKVSSKFGQSINAPDLKILGGSPRYSGANLRQIADQLSEMTIFDKII